MNLWPFRKPTLSDAARQMGQESKRQYRERVHAKCDEMREAMGLPKVEWPR